MGDIGRREFIRLIGGIAAAWPLVARAQRTSKLPTIGFLGSATPTSWSDNVSAFARRLSELGWIEGRTVVIQYRWAEGLTDRAAEIAADFVRQKADVIVTSGFLVPTVKRATSTIPIVFAVSNDPLGTGLVASLARPGGNVTGLSSQSNDLATKRLELLREVVPGLRRVGIMANAGYRAAEMEMAEVEATVRMLGLETTTAGVRRSEDVVPAFEALKGRIDALYVVTDALIGSNEIRISTLAAGARVAAIYGLKSYVKAGGLMSYGANYPDLFRRAGDFVDKILRGTKPADIPIDQPTKFELVVNLTSAKAIDLNIPESFLVRADEVIE